MFANCKCKLDTCTVELSESERRSGWKPLASVLGDAAAAFGCVNRVEELVKQFLRGAVAKLLVRPSVQLISSRQDVLWREGFNGGTLGHEGSEQPIVTLVLGTFPRSISSSSSKNESLCGQDLAERIGLSPATISHHMSSLVSAGFIHVDKQNPRGFNLEAARALFWRKKSRKQVTGLSAGDSLSI